MDRRQNPRVPARIPAILTVLSEPAREYEVVVEEVSGNGARVRVEARLAVDSVVKLIVEDDLFLGDVCHCQEAPGGYSVGLKLDCALVSLSSVRALMRALMPEAGQAGSGGAQTANPGDNRDHEESGQRHKEDPAQALNRAAPPEPPVE